MASLTGMRTPTLATLITGAVVAVGALATLVASEWPDLSPLTVGLLVALAGGGGWLTKSPLKGGAK